MPGELEKGDLVWFDPGVGYVLPGEVLEYHRAGQVVTVQAVIGGKPQVFTLTSLNGVRRRQDLGQYGIEDMIQLQELNEASLLWNLKIRYDKELIYTYTGSILVSVNPYKMFDIYGLDMVKKYEGQILGTLPPHLFAIGSGAYARMSKSPLAPPGDVSTLSRTGEDQVVIISGESGAGKTESTKLVTQYLAAVNRSPSNLITEQILEASPLLESFGNAKTVRNDNSSRFGKYLEIHFRDGVIIGAKITEYLLEKSRIVTQAPDERNYHVFYEMLKGLSTEQREKYGLLTAEKYFYLNQGGNCEIDGKYDNEDFQALLSAMQVLGFTSEEQDTIFRILASVLHLGNVYFHRKQLKHGQEGVEIGSDAEIRWTGHLLQLNVDGIKRALTLKTTEARNERLLTPLSIDQALDARDAFAKALYSSLFSWLVSRINQIIFKNTRRTSISILDIFGFEDFKENSFEQLCINYANENLQFYFNKHIFKLEQQEYAKEKIEWQTITYADNLPAISLIAKKPVGILHLLDDESNFPKATDLSFLEKCHYNHALNELYSRPRMSSMEFGIRHYAGQVWYTVDGFLDKNRDTLRHDVVELLISSKVSMLSKMFQNLRSNHEAAKTINKANGRFVTMKPRTPTVAARFHDSLQHLLESMSRCNPWFVRCVKPNSDKAPMKFDMPVVLEQLRYTGMLETIRIRKTGYPVRMRFSQFADHYRCLLPGRLPRGVPQREVCRAILQRYKMPSESNASDSENFIAAEFQLGTSRVFMRETLERKLEADRAVVLRKAAIKIQTQARAFLARRRYSAMKKSAVKVQSHVRGWIARTRYRKVRTGVVAAQANYRMKRQRRQYLELREELKRRAEVEKQARERAKAKQQREEQERASRAVAGVNHLEIPAELAFIFSKVDDWQPVHSERNLVKVVGGVPARPDRYYLPQDIDHHAFTKFTNIYFKSHLWGMKREPIKTPFLAKSKDIDYQDSLAIFKLILRFMNDNNLNGKKETILGDYILNKGIVNEKMRDEILCQLCNQTWKNDNDANNERGWLLMANCLSVFPPSKTLYKYLLKYVSDSAYDGYKALCQRKILQSGKIEHQLARTYPPCMLEWRANRKRVNMALQVHFADDESRMTPVESWTTGEELASLVVKERGISECSGWTVCLVEDDEGDEDSMMGEENDMRRGGRMGGQEVKDMNGYDYVLDLVSEMEVAPAFPVCKNFFLVSGKKGKRGKGMPSSPGVPLMVDVDDHPNSPRRPVVPPPEPPSSKQAVRKSSHEASPEKWGANGGEASGQGAGGRPKTRSHSRDHTGSPARGGQEIGLSRKSALNDRYFEDKARSRSLDNLLDSDSPRKLQHIGLSQSRLNDRYHSMEKIDAPNSPHGSGNSNSKIISASPVAMVGGGPMAVHNNEYMMKSEVVDDGLDSISQRGAQNQQQGGPMGRPGSRGEPTDSSTPKAWGKFGLSGRSNLNDRYFEKGHGPKSVDLQSEIESEFSQNMQSTEEFNRRHSTSNDPVVKRRVSSEFHNFSDKDSFRGRPNSHTQLNGHTNGSRMSPAQLDLPSSVISANELPDFDYPEIASQARSEDDKGSYIRGHPRFIKSHYAGKRAAPGSHSSRAYIDARNSEKSEYGAKSSALSDTSEAPSLASHVRRVRVPSQASDVDQFLDDLFMPVLDGNLDELSDARSLAASLKGGGEGPVGRVIVNNKNMTPSEGDDDEEVATLTGSVTSSTASRLLNVPASSGYQRRISGQDGKSGEGTAGVGNVDEYITDLFRPIFVNDSLRKLTKASTLADAIKGGGDGVGGMETQTSQSQTAFGFTPIAGMTSPTPMMSSLMSGMMSPPPVMMPTIPVYTPAASAASSSALTTAPPTSPYYSSTMPSSATAESAAMIPGMTPAMVTPGLAAPLGGMSASPSSLGTTGAEFSPPFSPGYQFMPVPIYNMQGLSLPTYQVAGNQQPSVDPSQVAAAYQQAFLQSAMAQNMQIQQQLLAQNQALQQLLQQQTQRSPQVTPTHQPGFPQVNMTVGPPQVLQMPGVSNILGTFSTTDSLNRNSKVSFREPDNRELWSTEKRQTTTTMGDSSSANAQSPPFIPPPPRPPKSLFIPTAQMSQSSPQQPPPPPPPPNLLSSPLANKPPQETNSQNLSPSSGKETGAIKKMNGRMPSQNSGNAHMAFGSVLDELKSRRSSTESQNGVAKVNSLVMESRKISNGGSSPLGGPPPPPPPPPPPMPPELIHSGGDPSEARPFLDPYGRAKTVRIGKWRWPPPKENAEQSDSFLEFKLRQHHRKSNPHLSPQEYMDSLERVEGIEWEEFEVSGLSASAVREISKTMTVEGRDGTVEIHDNKREIREVSYEIHENGDKRHSPENRGSNDAIEKSSRGDSRGAKDEDLGSSHSKDKASSGKRDSRESSLSPDGKDKHSKKSGDSSASRPTPGSIGKLRISSEMRQKLEMVTSNHSLRSTTKSEKPTLQVLKMKDESVNRPVKKLEDNRRLMLEQQLAGRWDTVDSIEAITRGVPKDERPDLQHPSIVRSQVERMEKTTPKYDDRMGGQRKPAPPPPPVAPHYVDVTPAMPTSRTNSYYSPSNTPVIPHPRSPPPPIQPIKQNRGDMYGMSRIDRERERDHDRDRRSSVSTHHTEKMERIEIEESPEFLKPVDSPAPLIIDRDYDKTLESIKTKLFPPSTAASFTYNRVNWKLHIRKEVFSPNESLNNPLALHLVFCQIVKDIFSPSCIRISREEHNKMRKMLDSYGVTMNNLHSAHHKVTIKKNVIDSAKEWPTYFARIFPVSGGHQNPNVQHLAVSHSGIRLIRREKSLPNDYLQVLDTITFDDVVETSVPKGSSIQLILQSGGRMVFYTHRANQIRSMIEKFIVESEKGSHEYVRALADYATREPSLLNFKKGDVIKLVNRDQYLQKGWLFGTVDGRSGVFPCEHVEALGRSEGPRAVAMHQKARAQTAFQQQQGGGKAAAEQHEALLSGWNRNHAGSGQVPASPVSSMPFHSLPTTPVSHLTSPHHQHHPPPSGTPPPPGDVDPRTANAVHDGRHSLLQFAMFHFRQSPEKFEMLKTADGTISGSLKVIESLKGKKALGGGKKGGSSGKEGGKDVADWTWKEQVDLVKFTATPIEESLLRLESPELSALAVECFVSVMRYMGDLPMPTPDTTEVKCVYTILMHCHKHEALRDEVYCQLMKQTTNNKSRQADSCQRGWRLFSIVAAYFICSSTLKPYLFKYLETAAYDKRRAYHGTATVCLQNLRKTFKYGGRKNVPSVEEITAISAGRNSKRQIYRLPGGTERVINTKSTTVVQDIIEEICSVINVRDTNEMEEFSLYCIVEGDTFTMPLAREEYVLDVTTELQKNQQVFFLIFCRSVWHHPLRLDSGLYVEVVFNQIAPDYLEGLLLVMPGEQLEQDAVYDIAKIAALLHRAADMEHMPTMKETKFLLPKPALAVRDIKPPQWVNMVQGNWREVEALTPMQAKAHTLDILQKWPLFGSSFFAVKRISDPKERADHILALNRNGVHFIDLVTHETLLHYPFAEVISTRKVKSEEGALFLDMKCGNLMQQRITRLQTDQAHEISRLIRQYITMEQRQRGINGNHTEQPQTVVPGSEAPVSR
ncbi:unconventional myosin-XV isoform X2 [Ischnura elegans]|uniref:unconventional myosin-XV isoform X2 n=1 Tax=Ischnura elegans TaxID=197161 RepID=UPI001ED87473|nr:unconventional myosin-XV isoform X2 [Ischnura elegans]